MAFGRQEFVTEGGRGIIRRLYPRYVDFAKFKPSEEISSRALEYISHTGFFPCQATLYNYAIAKFIGFYPDVDSMEDRLFALSYINFLRTNGYYLGYTNRKLVKYFVGVNTTSVVNQQNGTRQIMKKRMETIGSVLHFYNLPQEAKITSIT